MMTDYISALVLEKIVQELFLPKGNCSESGCNGDWMMMPVASVRLIVMIPECFVADAVKGTRNVSSLLVSYLLIWRL